MSKRWASVPSRPRPQGTWRSCRQQERSHEVSATSLCRQHDRLDEEQEPETERAQPSAKRSKHTFATHGRLVIQVKGLDFAFNSSPIILTVRITGWNPIVLCTQLLLAVEDMRPGGSASDEYQVDAGSGDDIHDHTEAHRRSNLA